MQKYSKIINTYDVIKLQQENKLQQETNLQQNSSILTSNPDSSSILNSNLDFQSEAQSEIDKAIAIQMGFVDNKNWIEGTFGNFGWTSTKSAETSTWSKQNVNYISSEDNVDKAKFRSEGNLNVKDYYSIFDVRFADELPLAYIHKSAPEYMSDLLRDYLSEHIESKTDFTNRVPFKTVHKEPKNFMASVLGYTMLGEGWIVLRDDLIGDRKYMVDVHESIHTNNEYETRIITNWMLTKEKLKYKM